MGGECVCGACRGVCVRVRRVHARNDLTMSRAAVTTAHSGQAAEQVCARRVRVHVRVRACVCACVRVCVCVQYVREAGLTKTQQRPINLTVLSEPNQT
jgi:hypothetical protein